jgi:hypothetical protein
LFSQNADTINMNDKKINIASLGQVSNEAIFVPCKVKQATVASSTLIYNEELQRVDTVYPKLALSETLQWAEVAYAHTAMTNTGSYYLLLVSEADMFGESRGVFIELLDYPPQPSQLGDMFTLHLSRRISAGLTACYRGDLDWLS